MIDKIFRIVASKVFNGTARNAFSMKMAAAIAMRTNVLIHVASAFSAVKFLYNGSIAKLGQMSVNTAFSACVISVDLKANFLCCKLSVGITRKKITDSAAPRSLINLLFHILSPSFSTFKIENSSQIIAQKLLLVNTI